MQLIAGAEFMEKRQTVEQQAQRLKILSEVAKLMACVKLLENTTEFNEKLDTATTSTVHAAKSKTSMYQEDNPKRSGYDDPREVIYNEIYQEQRQSHINSLVKKLFKRTVDILKLKGHL